MGLASRAASCPPQACVGGVTSVLCPPWDGKTGPWGRGCNPLPLGTDRDHQMQPLAPRLGLTPPLLSALICRHSIIQRPQKTTCSFSQFSQAWLSHMSVGAGPQQSQTHMWGKEAS